MGGSVKATAVQSQGMLKAWKRVAKSPSVREKDSFQASREMFFFCCLLCCKYTKLMYCHLLVFIPVRKPHCVKPSCGFSSPLAKSMPCTTESTSAKLYIQYQTAMKREYQESIVKI